MTADVPLGLLDGIHARWVALLRVMAAGDWARTFNHPEYPDGPRTLDWLLQAYAWHSRHHVAHITSLRQREGWLARPSAYARSQFARASARPRRSLGGGG